MEVNYKGDNVRKRKAKNKEAHAQPEAEGSAPEQSAGITQILKRYRSLPKGSSELPGEKRRKGETASPLQKPEAKGSAQRPKDGTGADEAAAVITAPEDVPEAALQQQATPAEQLQALQSNGDDTHQEDAKTAGEPQNGRKAIKQTSEAVLPWMRLPISIAPGQGVQLSDVGGLDARLKEALDTDGFVELYPVQVAAWRITAGGHSALHDICISAPTGSGKTLAYALPIVQGLLRRCVPQLRCLVVLPTRDLAAQVHSVFARLCPAVGLRAGLAAAQAPVAQEAAQLFGTAHEDSCSGVPRLPDVSAAPVDILVATPGRLMAHLKGTPGATLQHLHYLVVDEADRLLRQAYQDWLPFAVAAAGTQEGPQQQQGLPGRRVLKFVASATLTRDPAKIERLGLHCPRYLALEAADTRYALPRSLKEYKLVCSGADKPLFAIALLRQLSAEPTIVFTASLEATRRLYVLLSGVPDLASRAVEFSSLNSALERSEALRAFSNGEASLLVASDAMTRGMDVPSVAAVVNYDAPVYPKTYVHRAGRTARAGRAGRVYTILRKGEVRHFKGLLHKVNNTFVKDHRLPAQLLEAAKPAAAHALQVLQAYLTAESA